MASYVGVSYTPVEYIESSGTQYIDTGYCPYQTQTEIKFSQIDTTSSTENGICGVWNDNNNRYYVLNVSLNKSPKIFECYTREATAITLQNSVDSNIHTVVYNNSNNKVLWDNTEVGTVSNLTAQIQRPIFLFASNWQGGASILATTRIYYVKIFEKSTNTLVRDFVPVKDSNNVYCLFDKVENKAYYNNGDGTFAGGNETGEPNLTNGLATKIKKMYVGASTLYYTPVEYLQSSGSQWVDTGVVPKSTTRMVLEFSQIAATTGMTCGWSSSSSQEAFMAVASASLNVYSATVSSTHTAVNSSVTLDTNKHTFDISNSALKIDNITFGTGTIGNTATTGQTIFLFSLHSEWSPYINNTQLKLYSCRFYDGETLIRDYIPVKDKNGVACLYDKENDMFYYNGGTAPFTTGIEGTPVYTEVKAKKIRKGYVGIVNTFTPVEYIESSRTQYIDTNFSPNSNTKIEIRCSVGDTTTTEWFYSGRDYNGTTAINNFGFVKLNGQYRCDYFTQGTSTNYTWTTNTAYKVVQDKNKYYINDSLIYTSSTATFTTTNHLYLLGALSYDGSYGGLSLGKLYYCKIWDNGTLVRDFVPVKDSSNVYCLFDKVTNKAYYNKGGGAFSGGNATGETPLNAITAAKFYDKKLVVDKTVSVTYRGYGASIAASTNHLIMAGGGAALKNYVAYDRNYVLTTTNNNTYYNDSSGRTLNGKTIWIASSSSNVFMIDDNLTLAVGGTYTSGTYGVGACEVGNRILFTGGTGSLAYAFDGAGVRTAASNMSSSRYRHAQCNFAGSACILGGGTATMDIYNSSLTKTTATGLASNVRYINSAATRDFMICGQNSNTAVAVFNVNHTRLNAITTPNKVTTNCIAFDGNKEYVAFCNNATHCYIDNNLTTGTFKATVGLAEDTYQTTWIDNTVAVFGQTKIYIFEQ